MENKFIVPLTDLFNEGLRKTQFETAIDFILKLQLWTWTCVVRYFAYNFKSVSMGFLKSWFLQIPGCPCPYLGRLLQAIICLRIPRWLDLLLCHVMWAGLNVMWAGLPCDVSRSSMWCEQVCHVMWATCSPSDQLVPGWTGVGRRRQGGANFIPGIFRGLGRALMWFGGLRSGSSL